MGIYVSPGVYSIEKDLSEIIPNISTTTAALVGYSTKGALEVQTISTSQQFIKEYGQPDPGNYFHYSALAFLENGTTLFCLRVRNGALYGGVNIVSSTSEESSAGFSVGQSEIGFFNDSILTDEIFSIFGKDPGVWDNKISIVIRNVNNEYYDGNTDYPAEDVDQYTFTIDVYYENTDGVDELVESWTVSRKHKVDGYGRQMYLEDRINDYSDYIMVADNTASADTVVPKANSTLLPVTGGIDGAQATSAQIATAWEEFENPDDIDVRILINGGVTSVTVQQAMKTIAESRKDCIAVLDMPYDNIASIDDMIDWRRNTQNFNSSYSALYAPWVKIHDTYNDRILDVPPSGYVASMIAYNDYVAQPWYAPAGFNRGILNVLSISSVLAKGDRDQLYKYQINPLQTFRGQGNVIWGQKTEQFKESALSRLNVRRMLIVLEKSISIALQSFTFEPNSEFTRFRIVSMIKEYLDILSSQGAFQTELGDDGYKVVCDDTNNTPAVIDRNELHVDIFVKPSRAAEFIQLQTIVTSTGASFNELIAKGVML
jgi:phage tail sheath protein FI